MSSYKLKKTDGDTSWFVNDRFGMFIHFGLYSMPARHEWIKSLEEIPEEKYEKYFKYFNPDLFDAKEWAKKAKEAGMKYAVLTAKHHEGFCLFDSKYTDYKSTNTPFGRDIVKEYVEAFRAEGLKVGLYYSLIDWHHPDYQIDLFHPRRADEDAFEQNQGRDMAKYREYLHNQVREILTNYGKIDILWFDFSYPAREKISDNWVNRLALSRYKEWMGWTDKNTWDAENLIKMIREINPDIIINNRANIDQDIFTPEQTLTTEWMKYPGTDELAVWESCHTFSGSWGYFRDEMSWKTPEMMIRTLLDSVSRGGNLIMNVGPTSRGNFDYRANDALDVFGEWMKVNGRSIYGCTKAEPEFTAPNGCLLTQSEDGKRLYVHMIDYPYSELIMENIADKLDYAQLLHDGSEIITHQRGNNRLAFDVPGIKPKTTICTLELFLK